MALGIIVTGVVQALILLATLKYLGMALEALAIIPGTFINGLVVVFLLLPMAIACGFGFLMSLGPALVGSAAMAWLIRRSQGPRTLSILSRISIALLFAALNNLMLFLARAQLGNPLGLPPKTLASYSMAYVALSVGALINAGFTVLILGYRRSPSVPPAL